MPEGSVNKFVLAVAFVCITAVLFRWVIDNWAKRANIVVKFYMEARQKHILYQNVSDKTSILVQVDFPRQKLKTVWKNILKQILERFLIHPVEWITS